MLRVRPRRVTKDYRWVVLAVTTSCQAAVSLVSQGVPTLAPFIQAAFGLSRAQVGLFSSAMHIGSLPMIALAGRAVDVLGERKVIGAGAVVTGIAVAVASRMPSYGWALFALTLTGIWAASSTPAGSKAVMSWFPPRNRGMAMGIRQTGVPIGGMIAALILPAVARATDWNAALALAGAVSVLGGAACWVWYVDCPFDFMNIPAPSEACPPSETKRAMAWKDISSLVDRNMLLIGIPATLFVATQFIIVTYLQLFLREVMRFGPQAAANVLAVTQFAGMVSRVAWGYVSDRFFGGSRKQVIVLLGCGMTVGALGLASLQPGSRFLAVFLAAIMGSTTIGWNGLLITLLSELAGVEKAGTAVGIGLTFAQIGIIAGPPVFGYVVDVTGSYRTAWLLASAALALGTLSARMVREPGRQGSAP